MVGIKTVDIEGEKAIDEGKIEALAYQILNAEKEEEKLNFNDELKNLLRLELSKESAFKHPFNQLKSITVLTPPDSSFRIFNWNIPLNNGTYEYECGILKKEPGAETAELFFLNAVEKDSLFDEQKIYSKNQWIGGLIYELIQKESKLNTYYTLLVWDGNNRLTKKKRIDVLWFDQSEQIRFGAPIFKTNTSSVSNRIIFEYSAQNSMKLFYNDHDNKITLDHLVPSSSSLEGVYEYYGADLSFDAYYWKNNFWNYQADIDADNGIKKSKRDFKLNDEVIMEQEPIYTPQK